MHHKRSRPKLVRSPDFRSSKTDWGEERALIESKEKRYPVRAGGASDTGIRYVWYARPRWLSSTLIQAVFII